MATLKAELRELLERYSIDPRDKSKLWDCHGTLVLYHRAYEIIAAQEAIRFDPPTIIESDSKDKIVAILVMGHMGERSEWSIGEAAPGNCKNAYPYAIAEKRAKDRVVAKLVGLAAYVYSEDEADDFKAGGNVAEEAPPMRPTRPAAPVGNGGDVTSTDGSRTPSATGEHPRKADAADAYKRIKTAMLAAETPEMIDELLKANNDVFIPLIKEALPAHYDALMVLANGRKTEMYASA